MGLGGLSRSNSERSLASAYRRTDFRDMVRADAAAAADDGRPGVDPALPSRDRPAGQVGAELVETGIGLRILGLRRKGVGIDAEFERRRDATSVSRAARMAAAPSLRAGCS